MTETKWVQHKSGAGPKYRLANTFRGSWTVWRVPDDLSNMTYELPLDEYQACDPPEKWENVSGECRSTRLLSGVFCFSHGHNEALGADCNDDYQVRKVPVVFPDPHGRANVLESGGYAFIVERRVPA